MIKLLLIFISINLPAAEQRPDMRWLLRGPVYDILDQRIVLEDRILDEIKKHYPDIKIRSIYIALDDFRDSKSLMFSATTYGYWEVGMVEKGDGETCCIRGRIHPNGKSYKIVIPSKVIDFEKPEDEELMGISRTVKVKVTEWQLKDFVYPYDYDEFLNKVKAKNSFIGEPGELHYLSTFTKDKVVYKKGYYAFDSDEVIGVWSEQAQKVLIDYQKKTDDSLVDHNWICAKTGITGMKVYKKWLRIDTDCSAPGMPSEMPGYYLKRINRKWVLVFDTHIGVDPRYSLWIPKKVYEERPGISEKDIPDKIKKIFW